MIGESTYRPFAVNTFSGKGRSLDTITPLHYVHPHSVSSYTRSDGTPVRGYWRDGDGNTSVNRDFGYFARNPSAIPQILKKG